MIYILFFIIAIILFYYYYTREGFDLYPREGQYSADMFSSREIPIHLCSKIV
jgi:hypothetical protein